MKSLSPNYRTNTSNHTPPLTRKLPPQSQFLSQKQGLKKCFRSGNPFISTSNLKSAKNANLVSKQLSNIMPITSKGQMINWDRSPLNKIYKQSPKLKYVHRQVQSNCDLLQKNQITRSSSFNRKSPDRNFRFQVETLNQKKVIKLSRSRSIRIKKEEPSRCKIKRNNKSQNVSARIFQAPRLFENQIFDYKQDERGNNVDIELIEDEQINQNYPQHFLYLPQHIKLNSGTLAKQKTISKKIHNVTPEETTLSEQIPQKSQIDILQLTKHLSVNPKTQKKKPPSPILIQKGYDAQISSIDSFSKMKSIESQSITQCQQSPRAQSPTPKKAIQVNRSIIKKLSDLSRQIKKKVILNKNQQINGKNQKQSLTLKSLMANYSTFYETIQKQDTNETSWNSFLKEELRKLNKVQEHNMLIQFRQITLKSLQNIQSIKSNFFNYYFINIAIPFNQNLLIQLFSTTPLIIVTINLCISLLLYSSNFLLLKQQEKPQYDLSSTSQDKYINSSQFYFLRSNRFYVSSSFYYSYFLINIFLLTFQNRFPLQSIKYIISKYFQQY